MPAAKPARLAFTAMPSSLIVCSNTSREIGNTPAPQMAPRITELTTLPASAAAFSMSNSSVFFAMDFAADRILSLSKRPSPIAIFSASA